MASRWMTSATSRRVAPEPGVIPVSRGFTIFELLVAIGILVAVGGILIPLTLAEIERREVVLAEDQLGMLIQFARVEARRTGTPVEVMINAEGREVEVRRLDAASSGSGLFGVAEGRDADFASEVEVGPDDADPDRRVASRWARRSLPDMASLRPPPEAELDRDSFQFADSSNASESPASSTSLDLGVEQPWPGLSRFAVVFPDGSVVTMTPAVLASPGRLRSWEIDPWTGRSVFLPFAPSSSETSLEDENVGADEDFEEEFGLDGGFESPEDSS